jgi:hypothetical protein
MLAMAVLAGEQVAPGEIVESMASALSLYNLATLASRDLDRVKDCYTLWHGVHTEFEALCQAWESVPQDGELIGQHRAHLCRLLELIAVSSTLSPIQPAVNTPNAGNLSCAIPNRIQRS